MNALIIRAIDSANLDELCINTIHSLSSYPLWFSPKLFVLSNKLDSILFYSLLHHSNYNWFSANLLQSLQCGNKPPGYPGRRLIPGVDLITEPFGHGFANCRGITKTIACIAHS
jgi:transketolase